MTRHDSQAFRVASTYSLFFGCQIPIPAALMLTGPMADQAPSFESVQRALEAHLAPSVHLQSLPRALELLAHVALIADKLSEEVARILDVSARMHTRNRLEGLSDRSVERLQRCKADAEKVSTRIWQLSVDLRLNVSLFIFAITRELMNSAHRRRSVASEEGIDQDLIPDRLLLPGTYVQGRTIIFEKDVQIIETVHTRHVGSYCPRVQACRKGFSRMV